MAPKGSAIIYGKIQILSDGAPLSELRATLREILIEQGYPESHGMKARQDPIHTEDEEDEEQEDVLGELTQEEEEEQEVAEEAEEEKPPWVIRGRTNGVRKKE
jgi:hypothetical protein